ncbi:MAG: DUF1285 domain-containing protein [Porticoccaceae bacterium]|nr:DUF1285 domain-containing protein [Porticoccaceae bacterium]MDG1311715.1 DUF1285 domain-containing protein [Porticoccaceae bacterium]
MTPLQEHGLEHLFSDLLEQQKQSAETLPPVHLWHPQKSGDMDMRVDREGRWIHEGDEIKRQPLVKLFSRILKREGDDYFLLTPVEKWQIKIDIAPFFIVSARREIRGSNQAIVLNTLTEDQFVLGGQHPLWVETDGNSESPIPLVKVRDNLSGLLSRAVYYQLVDWGHEVIREDGGIDLYIASMGQQYKLGSMPEG